MATGRGLSEQLDFTKIQGKVWEEVSRAKVYVLIAYWEKRERGVVFSRPFLSLSKV